MVTVDALPKLTIAGRKRFSHEAVGVEHLSTASIQPRDLLALQSRDITERIGLDYDKGTLETSQSALEVDDEELTFPCVQSSRLRLLVGVSRRLGELVGFSL